MWRSIFEVDLSNSGPKTNSAIRIQVVLKAKPNHKVKLLWLNALQNPQRGITPAFSTQCFHWLWQKSHLQISHLRLRCKKEKWLGIFARQWSWTFWFHICPLVGRSFEIWYQINPVIIKFFRWWDGWFWGLKNRGLERTYILQICDSWAALLFFTLLYFTLIVCQYKIHT